MAIARGHRALLISILAVCLVVPGVAEEKEREPVIAGLATPALFCTVYTLTSDFPRAISLTIPGLGHLYAGDNGGLLSTLSLYAVGLSVSTVKSTFGSIITYGALCYDIIHAPFMVTAWLP